MNNLQDNVEEEGWNREEPSDAVEEQQQQGVVASHEVSDAGGDASADGDDKAPPEDGEEGDCCYRCLESGRCCKTCPRTCACVMGVILPLWFLIFLSVFFGVGLAAFEADAEVQANDLILQDRVRASVITNLALNFTKLIPRICLAAFVLRNETTYTELVDDYVLDQDFSEGILGFTEDYAGFIESQVQGEPVEINNWTEFNEYMADCGDRAKQQMDGWLDNLTDLVGTAAQDMSFNWIRCYPGAEGLHRDTASFLSSMGPSNTSIDTTFAAQEEIYTETWWSEFQKLGLNLGTASYNDAALTFQELRGVYFQALTGASGNATCDLNGPGSAWFWFTIMTTVGYGNQAPESRGGKTMVFTLGFVSILAFGAILGFAGYIVAAIVNDAFMRIPIIKTYYGPKIDVVMWAILTYTWMVVISIITRDWKERRLKEEISWGEGYWFAYISTTTIGLGDIFLEPEVFQRHDLMQFPLLFLTGFVFFSAFIGKLAEVLSSPAGSKKKSLLDALEEHMKKGVGTTEERADHVVKEDHGNGDKIEDGEE